MPTRNVVLTDQQSDMIDGLVASGRFQNASEAMRDAVRLLQEREASFAEFLERIELARRQVEAGETHSLDEVRTHLHDLRTKADTSSA